MLYLLYLWSHEPSSHYFIYTSYFILMTADTTRPDDDSFRCDRHWGGGGGFTTNDNRYILYDFFIFRFFEHAPSSSNNICFLCSVDGQLTTKATSTNALIPDGATGSGG